MKFLFSLFRYLPGDLFSFKSLHELHQNLEIDYCTKIREHKRDTAPYKPSDLIHAYLKKLKEDKEETILSGRFP